MEAIMGSTGLARKIFICLYLINEQTFEIGVKRIFAWLKKAGAFFSIQETSKVYYLQKT